VGRKARHRVKSSRLKVVGKWLAVPLAAIFLLTNLQVLALRFFNPPCTAFMFWQSIRKTRSIMHPRPVIHWCELDNISPYLRKAVLAGEDQRFLSHFGFDIIELEGAIKDLAGKKAKRGASTITMQVARTVYLWPGRSWIRKAIEAYYTILIELYWSKKRILEVYLNTVDWGTGIIGAEAASRAYFHVSCRSISKSQAAALAAILPSPHKWSPIRPSGHVLRRKKKILRDMAKMPLL